jgi:hypothetical protein
MKYICLQNRQKSIDSNQSISLIIITHTCHTKTYQHQQQHTENLLVAKYNQQHRLLATSSSYWQKIYLESKPPTLLNIVKNQQGHHHHQNKTPSTSTTIFNYLNYTLSN